MRAIGKLKNRKVEETVSQFMHRICELAWKEEKVPEDWTKVIVIPVYKGEGERN